VADQKFIDVQVDQVQLDRVRIQLAYIRNGLGRAIVSAINRTLTHCRATGARLIGQQINLKIGTIKEGIVADKASQARWQGMLRFSRKRFPVSEFGARQTKRGVSYRISRSGGRKTVPHGFMATMSTGHEGAFLRKDRAASSSGRDRYGRLRRHRLPIRELMGPSLGEVFIGPEVLGQAAADAQTWLAKEIDGQVARLVKQNPPDAEGASI
jgi:hypothetical protein